MAARDPEAPVSKQRWTELWLLFSVENTDGEIGVVTY